ncbi:hypothetical protein D3C87_1821060 [compost metagenome]
MHPVIQHVAAGQIGETAGGSQPAPAIPVFRVTQCLVETAKILKDAGFNQHDAAIDDEVSAQKRLEDETIRFFPPSDEVAPSDLGAILINALIIAVDGNDIRSGDAGA